MKTLITVLLSALFISQSQAQVPTCVEGSARGQCKPKTTAQCETEASPCFTGVRREPCKNDSQLVDRGNCAPSITYAGTETPPSSSFYCGNGLCNSGETPDTCPQDCIPPSGGGTLPGDGAACSNRSLSITATLGSQSLTCEGTTGTRNSGEGIRLGTFTNGVRGAIEGQCRDGRVFLTKAICSPSGGSTGTSTFTAGKCGPADGVPSPSFPERSTLCLSGTPRILSTTATRGIFFWQCVALGQAGVQYQVFDGLGQHDGTRSCQAPINQSTSECPLPERQSWASSIEGSYCTDNRPDPGPLGIPYLPGQVFPNGSRVSFTDARPSQSTPNQPCTTPGTPTTGPYPQDSFGTITLTCQGGRWTNAAGPATCTIRQCN